MVAPRMLFRRDFRGYTGGHGKVWDYFNHALALGWDARVFLTAESIAEGNPWLAMPERIVPRWSPGEADVLFLAGMDWQALDRHALDGTALGAGGEVRPMRIVNLVQHVRHAVDDPLVPLRGFLSRPAWRICVSRAVAQAVTGTGLVNGPVRVIPAALNLPDLPLAQDEDLGLGEPRTARGPAAAVDVFIGALKQPAFGMALGERLRSAGYRVDVSATLLPRNDYLSRLARAHTCVMLPHATEGFYLPGLEAMALGCALVMPDSGGSNEYARAGVNCLMPAQELEAMVAAVAELRAAAASRALVAQGRATAAAYTLAREARAFGNVLAEMGLAGTRLAWTGRG